MKLRLTKQVLCSKSLSPPYWYEPETIDIEFTEEDEKRIKEFVKSVTPTLLLVEDPA